MCGIIFVPNYLNFLIMHLRKTDDTVKCLPCVTNILGGGGSGPSLAQQICQVFTIPRALTAVAMAITPWNSDVPL